MKSRQLLSTLIEGDIDNLGRKLNVPGGGITCPHCKEVLPRMSSSTGKANFGPFTVALCIHCGGLSWMDDKKELHQASEEDLRFLFEKGKISAASLAFLQKASMKVRTAIAMGQIAMVPDILRDIQNGRN
jgi:hypothetical protein